MAGDVVVVVVVVAVLVPDLVPLLALALSRDQVHIHDVLVALGLAVWDADALLVLHSRDFLSFLVLLTLHFLAKQQQQKRHYPA